MFYVSLTLFYFISFWPWSRLNVKVDQSLSEGRYLEINDSTFHLKKKKFTAFPLVQTDSILSAYSYNPCKHYNYTMNQVLLHCSLYRWWMWCMKKWNILPKITQLISSRVKLPLRIRILNFAPFEMGIWGGKIDIYLWVYI